MKYYLGVDGGGSKTTAVVCDEKGNVTASFIGKSINYYSNSLETARLNFAEIIRALGINHFSGAVIGMSALSSRADKTVTDEFIKGIITSDNIVMDSDIAIALDSAIENSPRAVLICGTGSMAAAVNSNNEIIHIGGWGFLLGDEGSGYAIALRAVKAALNAIDDGIEDDILVREFRNYFDVYDTNEILDKFYKEFVSRDKLAGFSRVVFECSANGSNTAGAVISAEALEAANLATRIISKLPAGSKLYLHGGVFEHNKEYSALVKMFADPENKFIESLPHAPVIGALIDALILDKITVDDEILSNISKFEEKIK